jgi:hypothetical protein
MPPESFHARIVDAAHAIDRPDATAEVLGGTGAGLEYEGGEPPPESCGGPATGVTPCARLLLPHLTHRPAQLVGQTPLVRHSDGNTGPLGAVLSPLRRPGCSRALR